jgi:hypothetical protein
LVAPLRAGGLQMLLPGYFFEEMNVVNKTPDAKVGFEKYHELRNKFMKDY